VNDRERQDLIVLGRAIRDLREQSGLSLAGLAARAAVDRARVKALEDGRLDPGFDLLLALAEGMGVRPTAFFMRAEQLAQPGEEGPEP
jgi:transcriptional regulator with XRE-family HTH domain